MLSTLSIYYAYTKDDVLDDVCSKMMYWMTCAIYSHTCTEKWSTVWCMLTTIHTYTKYYVFDDVCYLISTHSKYDVLDDVCYLISIRIYETTYLRTYAISSHTYTHCLSLKENVTYFGNNYLLLLLVLLIYYCAQPKDIIVKEFILTYSIWLHKLIPKSSVLP